MLNKHIQKTQDSIRFFLTLNETNSFFPPNQGCVQEMKCVELPEPIAKKKHKLTRLLRLKTRVWRDEVNQTEKHVELSVTEPLVVPLTSLKHPTKRAGCNRKTRLSECLCV